MNMKQKMLSIWAIAALLVSAFFSVAAAPFDEGQHPSLPPKSESEHRPPIQFAQVGRPVSMDRPGAGARSTSVVYTPANIKSAYNYGAFANGGAGQAIAIIDAYGDPTLKSDVATFDSAFGLPAATVNIYQPDGAPKRRNAGWAVETALDVEWAHASAPYAIIDLIVSPDGSFQHMLDAINYVVNNLNVVAISMSWGAPETYISASMRAAYESAFAAAANKGIVLLASSGDQGAYDGTNQPTADYPSSSPGVTGVGGTTLLLNGSGGYGSETAWNGSGGGYSVYYSEPAYQSTAKIPDPTLMRGVPDVAFDANPNTGVYVAYNGSWYAVGGTSVGAPNWAAIVADNAAASAHPLNSSYLYGTVYGVSGASALYRSEMHDITSGNNGYYSAGSGWDALTGIGSPNVANLITAH